MNPDDGKVVCLQNSKEKTEEIPQNELNRALIHLRYSDIFIISPHKKTIATEEFQKDVSMLHMQLDYILNNKQFSEMTFLETLNRLIAFFDKNQLRLKIIDQLSEINNCAIQRIGELYEDFAEENHDKIAEFLALRIEEILKCTNPIEQTAQLLKLTAPNENGNRLVYLSSLNSYISQEIKRILDDNRSNFISKNSSANTTDLSSVSTLKKIGKLVKSLCFPENKILLVDYFTRLPSLAKQKFNEIAMQKELTVLSSWLDMNDKFFAAMLQEVEAYSTILSTLKEFPESTKRNEHTDAKSQHETKPSNNKVTTTEPPLTLSSFLLKHKSSLDAVNIHTNDGQTLLSLAVQTKNPSVVQQLLEHGADPNMANTSFAPHMNRPPLAVAQYLSNENSAIVKLLVDNGALVHNKTELNESPIIMALLNNRIKSVEYMLNTLPKEDIQKICEYAIEKYFDIDCIQYFFSKTYQNINFSPLLLQYISRRNLANTNIDFIESLLKYGADLSYQDKEGQSIVSIAQNSKNNKLSSFIKKYLQDLAFKK